MRNEASRVSSRGQALTNPHLWNSVPANTTEVLPGCISAVTSSGRAAAAATAALAPGLGQQKQQSRHRDGVSSVSGTEQSQLCERSQSVHQLNKWSDLDQSAAHRSARDSQRMQVASSANSKRGAAYARSSHRYISGNGLPPAWLLLYIQVHTWQYSQLRFKIPLCQQCMLRTGTGPQRFAKPSYALLSIPAGHLYGIAAWGWRGRWRGGGVRGAHPPETDSGHTVSSNCCRAMLMNSAAPA